MGCVCCSLSSLLSITLDALERISLCTVCAMLTCCLLITIITVTVIGIGIGFHYCFVQNSVDAMAKAAEAAGALRSGKAARRVLDSDGGVMRSVNKAVQRGFAHRLARREALSPPDFNNKTSSPAQVELNLDQVSSNSNFRFREKFYSALTNKANSTVQ